MNHSFTTKLSELNLQPTPVLSTSSSIFPADPALPSLSGTITSPTGAFSLTSVKYHDGHFHHYGTISSGSFKPNQTLTLTLSPETESLLKLYYSARYLIIVALQQLLPEVTPLYTTNTNSITTIEFANLIDHTLKPTLASTISDLIEANLPLELIPATTKLAVKHGIDPDIFKHTLYDHILSISSYHIPAPSLPLLTSTSQIPPITIKDIAYSNHITQLNFSLSHKTSTPAPNQSTPTSLNLEELSQTLTTDQSRLSGPELQQKYLSKSGIFTTLTKNLSSYPQTERKTIGQTLNQLKTQLTTHLNSQHHLPTDSFDPTAVSLPTPLGHLHPITQAISRITTIFNSIGFTRVRHPEVDWDFFAFEGLNMPKGHPARDEWETFFVDHPQDPKYGKLVLTPHTSNGQVREMLATKSPPIRMINITRTFRRQQDVTHTSMFHQFEGLVIDQGISIPHLKGVIDYFARQFYGPSAKSRIRPFNFSFTEPSFEVDFSCTLCLGKGCRFCKSGWHEVGGAGMVHPNVLKAGNIDPERFTGFAFGWGIERTYTLIPGLKLDDIRLFYQNKYEFLSQF